MDEIPVYPIKKEEKLTLDELEQKDDFFELEIPITISIPKEYRKNLIKSIFSDLISMDSFKPIEESDMVDFLVMYHESGIICLDDIVDNNELKTILSQIWDEQ